MFFESFYRFCCKNILAQCADGYSIITTEKLTCVKGQNARSGGGVALGFEGGQLPLFRRLPKRGFKNVNHVNYATINVGELNRFKDGTVVSPALLKEEGLLSREYDGLKVLGGGKLEKKLTVQAKAFSKSAEKAISDAGGKIEVI